MTTTNRTTVRDRIREAVRKAYPLPPELARLANMATFDLWHGPMAMGFRDDGDDGEPWPGFSAACDRLSAWADEHMPSEAWYDDDAGSLSDVAPEPWQDEEGEWHEPYTDETYHVERRDLLAARFPNQLSEYLS